MIINTKVTVLKAELKEGIARKSGEKYSMLLVKIMDNDYNVFDVGVDQTFKEDQKRMDAVLNIKNEEHDVILQIKPKGFDLAMYLVSVK